MRIEVLSTVWGADGDEFAGGTHEIKKPSAKFLKLAAAAEAAGAIKVTASSDERTRMRAHVETQAESERAYAKAQKDGSWHAANYDQFVADREAGAPTGAGPVPDRDTYIAERVSG